MASRFRRLDGTEAELPDEALRAFQSSFRGTVLLPSDPSYDATRQVWNALIASGGNEAGFAFVTAFADPRS